MNGKRVTSNSSNEVKEKQDIMSLEELQAELEAEQTMLKEHEEDMPQYLKGMLKE